MGNKTKVSGQFSLDKVLSDTRHSPRALFPPEDEDILVIDQHTNDQGLVEYTKTVGVVKDVRNSKGKLEFDWIVTDPGLKELVDNADHPEKLFMYSPEFVPINKTEKYDQGEYGKLKRFAITNMANDDEAFTNKIINIIKNTFNPQDNKNIGDNMVEMDEKQVQEMIDKAVEPYKQFNERLEKLDEIEGALEKFDPTKLDEVVTALTGLKELPQKVETLEKNIKDINAPLESEREELVKNLKTNQDIISEDSLVKMNIEDLRNLDKRYQKTPTGSFGTDTNPQDIVAQINAEYGTDVGASLNQPPEGDK